MLSEEHEKPLGLKTGVTPVMSNDINRNFFLSKKGLLRVDGRSLQLRKFSNMIYFLSLKPRMSLYKFSAFKY